MRQTIDRASLVRFAVAIGHEPDHVPALAHWAWFPDVVADRDIGVDGHPRPGALLPDTGKTRRMFASAEIAFEAPLLFDQETELTEHVGAPRVRAGRSGELALVAVERRLAQDDRVCVSEMRTLVYRDPGPAVSLSPSGPGEWTPNEASLFRFSAATFNAHRIHYDRDYARNVEGYPDLVVQGPFTACRLAELAARRGPLAHFSFRAEAPLFVGQPVQLADDGGGAYRAIRGDGVTAMTAIARWIDA